MVLGKEPRMTRFVYQSACRGQRPARVQAPRYHSRPARVALLARERRRARFLVAPHGFGKAMLAAEYAETMFGFRHVFWINAASPCFLRDLDEGSLAADLETVDEKTALVVFADVPLLDEERAERFAALVGNLMAAHIEVVATTTPGCDSASGLVPDALVVDGSLLLVDEGECAAGSLPEEPAARVACLVWAADGPSFLAEGCAHEELPADLRAALWAMLVMGRGQKGDLRALLGADRGDEAWACLGAAYPFLGIDEDEETFQAAPLDLGVVVRAFAGAMEPMARAVGCGRRGDLACLLADRLLSAGEGPRAASLVGAVAPRAAVGAWLGRCGWELVRQGAAGEVCRLYEVACRAKLAERFSVNAMVACAYAQLGRRAQALDFARKVVSATLAPTSLKVAAALCAHRQGTAEVRRRIEEVMAPWLEARRGDAGAGHKGCPSDELLALLVEVSLDREGGRASTLCRRRLGDASWAGALTEEAQGCLLAVAWAIDARASLGMPESACSGEGADEVAYLARWALGVVEERAVEGRSLGFGGEEAVLALDRVGSWLEALGAPRPAVGLVEEACAARVRRERAAGTARAEDAAALPVSTGGRPMRRAGVSAAPLVRATPLLEVRLFGGVRAFIGGREVSPRLLAIPRPARPARAAPGLRACPRGPGGHVVAARRCAHRSQELLPALAEPAVDSLGGRRLPLSGARPLRMPAGSGAVYQRRHGVSGRGASAAVRLRRAHDQLGAALRAGENDVLRRARPVRDG